MREPFSAVLPSDERLVAGGEAERGVNTGPLAGLGEMLSFISPVLSIVLVLRLDGVVPKILGAVLPPLVIILIARYPMRRWHRPREWVGVTNRRLLIWRSPAAIVPRPRIEAIPVDGVEGVELVRDRWDEAHGTHQIVLHYAVRQSNIARARNAEQLRDAIVALVQATTPAGPPPPPPPPADYRPPTPADYRP